MMFSRRPALLPSRPVAIVRGRSPMAGRAWCLALMAAGLLSACGGMPLRFPGGRPPPAQLPSAPAVPAPMATPPVAPMAPIPALPAVPRAAVDIEAAAVAARFPAPAVAYDTPGLAPGRERYTSNAELQAQLRTLVRPGNAAAGQPMVRLLVAGTSQRGVPIEALWFSLGNDAGGPGARTDSRPTVAFVAQQHGDEPAGAEAMLVLARQLANGPLQPLLRQLNVIVLPRANPDGAVLGERLTSNGIDANRDHLLLRTPEARALAGLLAEHRPMVVVDVHEYSAVGDWPRQLGVVRRHDLLLQYAMTPNMAEFVSRAAEEWFRQPLLTALAREQLSVDWYHMLASDLPDKPVKMGSPRPDTLRNVQGLRHAVSLLVESRGVGLGRQHLQRRVHSQLVASTSILQSAARRAEDLQKLRRFVDNDVGSQACQGQVVLEAEPTPSEYNLLALDPQTGLDRRLSVNWQSALVLRPLRSRGRPCGYWLAADQAEAVQRLRLLGLRVQQVPESFSLRGETYRVPSAAWRDVVLTSSQVADTGYAPPVPVELSPALVELPAGSFFVPLTQPMALLAVAALEPDSPSSYLAHGVIDRADAIARIASLPSVRMQGLP